MAQSVGEFLKEKMGNMSRWVEGELHVDLKQYVAARTERECTYIAGLLSTNSDKITLRDWSGLASVGDLPQELQRVFLLIRQREDMHDKFWRYMDMFVQVISNDTFVKHEQN